MNSVDFFNRRINNEMIKSIDFVSFELFNQKGKKDWGRKSDNLDYLSRFHFSNHSLRFKSEVINWKQAFGNRK